MSDNATIKLGLNTSAVTTGLAAVKSQFAELKTFGAAQIAGSFGAVGLAAGLTAGLASVIDEAGKINDIAERFGILPEELQRIGNVASQSGGSLESVGAALNKLALNQEKARSGSEEHRAALADLNIEAAEFINLSPEDAFYRVANAVAETKDRGKAYSAVVALMGKSSGELFTTLELGAQKIREAGDAMGIFSNSTTRGLDNVGDGFGKFKHRLFTDFAPAALFVINLARTVYQALNTIGQALAVPLFDKTKDWKSALADVANEFNRQMDDIWEPKAPEQKPRVDHDLENDTGKEEARKGRLQSLAERLADFQQKALLDQLSGEEKINELMRQRQELIAKAFAESDSEKQIAGQIRVLELDKEIREARERADEQAGRDAEQLANKQQGLRDKQFRNYLATADDAEKKRALEAKRAQLVERAKKESDQSKRADIGGDVLDIDSQLAALRQKKGETKTEHRGEIVASRLTKIGLGSGAYMARTRDPAEKSARSLEKIERTGDRHTQLLERIAEKQSTWSP